MRSRSELWQDIVASGEFKMETVVRIFGATGDDPNGEDGVEDGQPYKEYATITAPIITRSLLSGDTVSIGNCNAGMLSFTIMTTDTIPRAAKIKVFSRPTELEREFGEFVDLDTEEEIEPNEENVPEPKAAEWLEFGTFWLDTREVDDDLIDIEAYDAMKKGNQIYSDDSEMMSWPKTISEVVIRIAAQMGETINGVLQSLAIDSRTIADVIESEFGQQSIVTMPDDDDTLLDLLKQIGEVMGGNWTITPTNELRFVPLTTIPAVTNYIIDNHYNRITSNQGDNLMWKDNPETEEQAENSAGGELINVPVVIGSITTARNYTISKVTMTVDSDHAYMRGDDSGFDLVVENNPYANQGICGALYDAVVGIEYAPFSLNNACFDPAAELSDWIVAGDKVRSVIFAMTQRLDLNYQVDVSAPGEDEVESEYPYKSPIKKTLYRVQAEADEAYSQIAQSQDSISAFVRKGDIISSINLSIEEDGGSVAKISANKLDFSGVATFADLAGEGKTTINGSNIVTGYMSADRLHGGTLTLGGRNNGNGSLAIYDTNNDLIGGWNNAGIVLNKGIISGGSSIENGTSSWDLNTGILTTVGQDVYDDGDTTVYGNQYKTVLDKGTLTFSIRESSDDSWIDCVSIGIRDSYTAGLIPAGGYGTCALDASTVSDGVVTGGSQVKSGTSGEVEIRCDRLRIGPLNPNDPNYVIGGYDGYTGNINTSSGTVKVVNGFVVEVR